MRAVVPGREMCGLQEEVRIRWTLLGMMAALVQREEVEAAMQAQGGARRERRWAEGPWVVECGIAGVVRCVCDVCVAHVCRNKRRAERYFCVFDHDALSRWAEVCGVLAGGTLVIIRRGVLETTTRRVAEVVAGWVAEVRVAPLQPVPCTTLALGRWSGAQRPEDGRHCEMCERVAANLESVLLGDGYQDSGARWLSDSSPTERPKYESTGNRTILSPNRRSMVPGP